MINNFSLIIVTYNKEFFKLLLLLNSIELYAKNLFANITIIINEDGNVLETKLKKVIQNLNNSKYHITSYKYYFDDVELKIDGWYSQQILKLLAAARSEYDYSLILDTKQHFVNFVSSIDFFINGKPMYVKTHEDYEHSKYMGIALKNSYEEWGENFLNPKYHLNSMGCLTPFIFVKKLVNEMILELENKYRSKFYKIFLERNFSEFYLYSSYVHSHYDLSDIYSSTPNNEISKIIWAHNKHALNIFIDLINKNKIKIFGVHHSTSGVLTSEEKILLNNFYFDKKILNEENLAVKESNFLIT